MHDKNQTKLIDFEALKSSVDNQSKESIHWLYSQNTGSTNSDLLQLAKSPAIAISESQQAGRGQRQNQWDSGFAENLLFSFSYRLNVNEKLVLLPILIGLTIKSVLDSNGFSDISLKWPNDIYYQGKKVAGILVETNTQGQQVLAVVGVGLNVNTDLEDSNDRISLKQGLAQPINRTALLEQCLVAVQQLLSQPFANSKHIMEKFNQANYFQLKQISFNYQQQLISGVCQGINLGGELVIQSNGQNQSFATGSIVVT